MQTLPTQLYKLIKVALSSIKTAMRSCNAVKISQRLGSTLLTKKDLDPRAYRRNLLDLLHQTSNTMEILLVIKQMVQMNSYCWCDLPNNNLEYLGNQLNSCWPLNLNVGVENNPTSLFSNLNYEANMKMSKNDINLELLKEFEYDTEMREIEGEEELQTIYICRFHNCNKEFTRTWNILDHARMHRGIKPYKCDYCLKEFTQKGNLRKHLKTHLVPNIDQRKRYKCEYCDSSYTERYNYKAHLKKHHVERANNSRSSRRD